MSEDSAVVSELHDTFARIRAQLHVLRLAVPGLRMEADEHALLQHLLAIEEELQVSEELLRTGGTASPARTGDP